MTTAAAIANDGDADPEVFPDCSRSYAASWRMRWLDGSDTHLGIPV